MAAAQRVQPAGLSIPRAAASASRYSRRAARDHELGMKSMRTGASSADSRVSSSARGRTQPATEATRTLHQQQDHGQHLGQEEQRRGGAEEAQRPLGMPPGHNGKSWLGSTKYRGSERYAWPAAR